jgi:hypothetical protein
MGDVSPKPVLEPRRWTLDTPAPSWSLPRPHRDSGSHSAAAGSHAKAATVDAPGPAPAVAHAALRVTRLTTPFKRRVLAPDTYSRPLTPPSS